MSPEKWGVTPLEHALAGVTFEAHLGRDEPGLNWPDFLEVRGSRMPDDNESDRRPTVENRLRA